MDLDPESAKNQQTEPLDANFSSSNSLIFHLPCAYNFGGALPGFFVPFPSYPMYLNMAVEQLVPGGFRASFPNGVRERRTGHEGLGAASNQIQDLLQLGTSHELDFDSAPRFEIGALDASPRQHDGLSGTVPHYTSRNGLDHPQAGTIAYASSDPHSCYPTTEQRDWYNGPATRDNMPNGFDFAWQGHAAHDPFMNDLDQDASTNLLYSDRTSEESHLSGNGGFDIPLSPVPSNIEMSLAINTSVQASTFTYDTSSPLQESFNHVTIPSSSPETSFSSALTISPTPSPTHAPSPNSTRHPCPHPHCHSTFARQSDLSRHAKIHFPERHRKYHCWKPGCDRNGRKGFTRRDKWKDHVRSVHRLEDDGGRV